MNAYIANEARLLLTMVQSLKLLNLSTWCCQFL
jgi:hypothetical protein